MKITYITTVLVLFLMIPTKYQAQTNSDTNNPTDTLTFTIYGMDCPGCEGGIEKQVEKIPSIQYAKAIWDKQELKIVLVKGATLDIDELNKRVKKANFTLVTDPKNKK